MYPRCIRYLVCVFIVGVYPRKGRTDGSHEPKHGGVFLRLRRKDERVWLAARTTTQDPPLRGSTVMYHTWCTPRLLLHVVVRMCVFVFPPGLPSVFLFKHPAGGGEARRFPHIKHDETYMCAVCRFDSMLPWRKQQYAAHTHATIALNLPRAREYADPT